MLGQFLLSWSLISCVAALSPDRLYPFGIYEGDEALPKSDDIASEQIRLKVPIKFFSELYDSIYVNNNGLVSLLGPLEEYVTVQFPIEYLIIAPLYANVDTRRGGTVWFRESQDPAILQRASDELSEFYPSQATITPKAVFIATWDKVAHVNATGQTNTFQLVLANDGNESYLELLYPDGGIQWIRTRGQGQALADAKAQAGLVSHDARLFTLPNSGTDRIRFLDKLSNAGEAGLFVFRIGNIGETENVEPPPLYEELHEQEPSNCAQGFTKCHSKAKCVDVEDGICCVCTEGYYGNGIDCLKEDVALRVSGKVKMAEEGDMYLQAYLVPQAGESFTAVTKVPPRLGPSIQLLEPLAATLGWLIAKPISGGFNGFHLTGGVFNSTIEVRWPGGEKMTVNAKYLGVDIMDQLRMEAEVSGTLPAVPSHRMLSIQDYIQDLTATSPGHLRSQMQLNILVDHKEKDKGIFILTKTESIHYDPVCSSERNLSPLRLKSSRHQVSFMNNERVARFASVNKISSNLEGEDPCIEGQVKCVANSSCVVHGDSFKCICNQGFEVMTSATGDHDGCVDINECEEGSADCHPQAICLNEIGTFHCQCRPGYHGDGQNCVSEETCSDGDCRQPANGYCSEPDNPETCQCNPGYAGYLNEGFECLDVNECLEAGTCGGEDRSECLNTEGSYRCLCRSGYQLVNNICSSTAEDETDPCDEDPESCQPQNGYCDNVRDYSTCRCIAGWRGTVSAGGFKCVDRNECAEDSPCDSNAQCFNNWGSFHCTCRHGYTGDGFTCSPEQRLEDCSDLDCGPRSHCEEDLDGPRCVCDSQYSGQYPHCMDIEEIDCYEDSECGENGRCDLSNNLYRCVCNEGYTGNGFRCSPSSAAPPSIVRTCLNGECWCPAGYQDNGSYCVKGQRGPEQCKEPCSTHAQCLWVTHVQDYHCTCNPGYEGDGVECTEMEINCTVTQICDIFATCRYDEISGRDICICNEGYVGDGTTCYPTDECTSSEDCRPNESCLYNPDKRASECVCAPGFIKDRDGNCLATDECTSSEDCRPNEGCLYNPDKGASECVCAPGFIRDRDGNCLATGESSEETCGECSRFASCVKGRCICQQGYRGDGFTCDADCSVQGGCSQHADCIYNTYNFSYSCICRQGYEGDGYTCSLERNCQNIPEMCSVYATCLRTAQKTYICNCNQGYYGNGSVCKEGKKLDDGGFLLVNQGRSTLQIPLENGPDNKGRPILFHHDQAPIGIAVDCLEGRVYWSDIARKSIQSSRYDGSEIQPVITSGLESSEGIAIDWLNRAIYWTDSGLDTISRADMDSGDVTIIVNNGLVNPRGIAVHPTRRRVYWSDWDREDPKLEVSGLDGSDRSVLLKGKHVKLPNSLAIDWSTDELCWADAGTKNIECLDLSSGLHRTAVSNCNYPFGLAITPDKFYWTDWVTHKIESAYKNGRMSQPIQLLFGGGDKLYGVAAITDSCPN